MLLLATLAMVTLTVTVTIPEPGNKDAPVPLDDPSLLAVAVGEGFGVPVVLAVLLGSMAFTQEFRHGTITSTYLVEPRRPRVLVAKWLTLALVSAVITTGTLMVGAPFGMALINARGGEVSVGAQFWQMAVAGFGVMAVYAVIGVAIGALLRNQITAVVGVLVWMLAIERLVLSAYPAVGRWTPGAAIYAVMQTGAAAGLDRELLSPLVSALLLAAYAALAVALALRLTPKRDIL